MRCGRCGAVFEGRFCPACGSPATVPGMESAYAAAQGWPCPRCGTVYRGNFCPRCGQPAFAAYAVSPPARSAAGRSVLSILWTISIAGFLILVALDLTALVLGPGLVVPGIQGVRQGATVNRDLDIDGNSWTFVRVAPTAAGVHRIASGNGYLEMSALTDAGLQVIGFWYQPFEVIGSTPIASSVELDLRVDLGSSATLGTLFVFVEPSPSLPALDDAIGRVDLPASTADWIRTDRFLADEGIDAPGTYYLLLAFATTGTAAGTPTVVAIDNVGLVWTTDAGVVLFVALPFPARIFTTQDQGVFLAYYGFVVAAILVATIYPALRERRTAAAALFAPLEAIGARLKNRNVWLTVGQVWLAVTFFQVSVIVLLGALGALPAAPFEPNPTNIWVILYELANASVYEEFAFRVLLIGVPLAVGSFVLRVLEVNRSGGTWRGSTTAGRYILGSLRYLLGGGVRGTPSRETVLAAWAFLILGSAIFGLAHLPAWGWWKVFPSAVAGLGFGYLFLRHGVAAAILAHFVNDYAFALVWMGVGGLALDVFLSLLFLALAAAGSGFFVWYLIYAWRHLRELWTRFFGERPRPIAIPPPIPSPAELAVPRPVAASQPAWPRGPAPVPAATSRDPMVLPTGYVPSYRPPPYGYPPVRFQCPACGWVEARYDAGHFTCVRCGKTS